MIRSDYIKRIASGRGLLAAVLLTISVTISLPVISQDGRKQKRPPKTMFSQAVAYNRDSLPPLTDSMKAVLDSMRVADSLFKIDSAALQKKSSLDRPAFSTGKDSTIEVFSGGQKKVFLYGDVTVKYRDMELTADYMEYDMNTGTVFARGTLDTLTGEVKGQPVMKQGGSSYSMEELRYNFNTNKARITNMITQQDEGLLHGKNIKMMPDKSINITKGQYTVCDLEHPHYYLHLTAAKVITKPSQKTVFGPAYPVIEDVPMPIALPFGFVPKRPDRATGMLMPTFGEENSRGFYLKDMGMYFVFGDYVDLSVTGDIYTLGSWALNVNSRYKINYKATGNFSLNISNDQTGERGSTDFFQTRNFGLKWSHSQDSKAHPGTTFSASVSFSSPSNSKYNSHSVNEALQNQTSSSISYSKNWNGKFNLSINALHNQNSRDSSYAFTLPNLTFSVTRFYPFKQKYRVGKEKFYEKFSLGYSTTLQNKINFKASEFMKEGFLDKFQNGMTHSFQIGLPNFTIAKYLNVTPSISYGMNWYFRKTEYYFNPETNKVESRDGGQFSAFGISQTYSGSVSMSTRLYGMFNFGKAHKIQAIRHVVSPSISLSVSPEKGTYMNGWRTLNYTDTLGVEKSYDYNIYSGQLYSPPGKGKSATMSISIGNNLEAKVRDLRDTTGAGVKKVKLIDQLNLSTGYNFLAEKFKMNNIGITMSTSVFGKLGINGNANFDPYAIDEKGTRINKFNCTVNEWWKIARLTAASASLSYSISGKGAMNGNDGSKTQNSGGGDAPQNSADYYRRIYYHPLTGEYIPGGWLYYTNPNVPWSLNINYSFSYSKSYQYTNGQLIKNNRYTQTVGLNGNIKLTPKMSINMTTGFDLMAMKMTTTQFSAQYDLHCFNIAVSWVPTGTWQSWSFRIAANAAALADLLKFKKSTSYWDR
ncbi:MAG: putative LPS assembly protein LptD [Bacteroidales bacterium]|nr:putative LPS assembly protein LptD [Bacteroidales bacterium]